MTRGATMPFRVAMPEFGTSNSGHHARTPLTGSHRLQLEPNPYGAKLLLQQLIDLLEHRHLWCGQHVLEAICILRFGQQRLQTRRVMRI